MVSKQGSSISFPDESELAGKRTLPEVWAGSEGFLVMERAAVERELCCLASPRAKPQLQTVQGQSLSPSGKPASTYTLCSPLCAAGLSSGLEAGAFKYPFHSAVQSEPVGWVLHPCHVTGRSEGREPRVSSALDGDLLAL